MMNDFYEHQDTRYDHLDMDPYEAEHLRRRKLVNASVTLNGQRAVISGVRNDFATVTALPDGESYEWAWDTAERIVASGGRFVS